MARDRIEQEGDIMLHVAMINDFKHAEDWLASDVLKDNGKTNESKVRFALESDIMGRLSIDERKRVQKICKEFINGNVKERVKHSPATKAKEKAEANDKKMDAMMDAIAALTASQTQKVEATVPTPVQAEAPPISFGEGFTNKEVEKKVACAVFAPVAKPVKEVVTSDIVTTLGTYKSIQGLLGRISPMYPTIDMSVLQDMADKLIDNEGVTHLRKDDEFITVTEALVDACTLYQKSVLLEIPFRIESIKGVLFDEEEETTKIEATPTVSKLDEEVKGSSEKEDVTQYIYGIGKMKKWGNNVIYPQDRMKFVKHATATNYCKTKNDSIGEKVYKVIKLK
ncbi:MAG: hypothetical protein HRU12_01930 [Phaeodactylibacter sp.]|nr:hypothetical protein [Phaeodactylibacter sp.]